MKEIFFRVNFHIISPMKNNKKYIGCDCIEIQFLVACNETNTASSFFMNF